MQYFKTLICLLFILVSISINAQKKESKKVSTANTSIKEFFEDAEFFFEQEDYKEALYNFQKVLEKTPDNANILFRIGMCYINIPGEETKSIPYFEKAKSKINIKYKGSNFEENKAPLYLFFYLGNAYRINNELGKALECYNKFRNHPSFEGNYNLDMVETEIAACERAKLIQDNPIDLTYNNLGPLINNANSNKRPVVDPNETVLIYLSSLKFYDAIFMSQKIDGLWSEPLNISDQIGSDGDCEPACISADGKLLYLIKKNKGNYDIYVSKKDGDFWKPMQPLNKNINSSKMETSASISRDGKYLYFSSDRRGGEGKLDIWVSERKEDGEWGPAKNLGTSINSDLNENMPYICDDGVTLYFTSEGNLSMGGYDIFTSTLSNNKWEVPANIGYPANTTGNDVYWLPLKNGEVVYSALFRPEGNGQEDIYRIENLTIQNRLQKVGNTSSPVYKVFVKNKVSNKVVGVLLYDKNPDSLKNNKSSEFIEVKIKK